MQYGHDGPVEAAAWTPDGRYLITAAAIDRSLLIWDVASGHVIDTARLPVFDTPAGFALAKVRSVAVSADGAGVLVTLLAVRAGAGSRLAAARYKVSFGLADRAATFVGAPEIVEGGVSTGEADISSLAAKQPDAVLPDSPDGAWKLERVSRPCSSSPCQSDEFGVRLSSRKGALPSRDLVGADQRGLYADVDVSPDGKLLARLVPIYGGGATLVAGLRPVSPTAP